MLKINDYAYKNYRVVKRVDMDARRPMTKKTKLHKKMKKMKQ